MIFFDTETCGLHGPIVLLQYAIDDGPIELYDIWLHEVGETVELIEMITNHPGGICGFNLAFDWFHICQMYTTLKLLPQDALLSDIIDEYAVAEADGRFGDCLKPMHAIDLMLHARKGPYQSTMDRKPITIRRVPTQLAWHLAKELASRIPLKDVYFARNKDISKRWVVHNIKNEDDEVIPEFKDVVLKFNPSSALKALAQDALGVDSESVKFFSDVEPPKKSYPVELGYAPFALAIGKPGDWKGAWPDYGKIRVHISHWADYTPARQYASDDVKYTRGLYHYFKQPAVDDDDSVLACMVGAVRWHGFKIDIPALKNLRNTAIDSQEIGFNWRSPKIVKKYITEVMSPMELLALKVDGKISTKGTILEEVSKWKEQGVCDDCNGTGCEKCNEGFIESEIIHPAAIRAQMVLKARRAAKEVELYDKLITAGRFHASFKVIGTLSSRMSGADKLNPQGIKRQVEVRECFPLADDGFVLSGGDFKGFEVTIADAVYKDPVLHEKLLSGKKIHGLFGIHLFPEMTYEQILKSEGLPGDKDKYTRSKNGVFAILYGGDENTLVTRVGVKLEQAEAAHRGWCEEHKVWGQERKKIFDMFCSMRQPNGIGSKVEWNEPADSIASMFGFRRYFTLENMICKTLFELAEDPPKSWMALKIKVVRRERIQTACGASRSALFAAAFGVQSANMRAGANHVIQSAGATITKMLQKNIWDLQPAGINDWRVIPMNVHDEVMSPVRPDLVSKIKDVADNLIDELKPKVPLIGIDWMSEIPNWAGKKKK